MNILSETQKAYIAGIIDGEGCISIIRQKSKKSVNWAYSLSLVIGGNERCLVDYILQTTGVGSLKVYDVDYRNKIGVIGSVKNLNAFYRWQAQYTEAIEILRAVYPFLIIKKDQADVAIEFAAIETRRSGRGGMVEPDIIAKRQELKDKLSELKGTSSNRGRKPRKL